MKRKKIIIIIASIAVLSAAAIWFFRYREKEQPVALTTEKPHYGYIATSVMATGTVQPVDTVAVGTQVSGTIKKIFVDFNSVVKKGQLLAQLDQSILMAQVQQTAATLQQAKSNFNYQQSNYNRQSQLYKAGAISKADLELANNQYKTAADQIKVNAAQVASSQKNLSFSNIYSPIDGTILSRTVSEGQTVASSFSTPTLFSIAKDLTKMQVRASVDEADIGNVRMGERVTFTVDAFPNDTFNGTVQEIRLQPTVASNVVTYTTIINAPNNDLKLKPGMTANINIYTQEVNNGMLIPAKALKFTPDASVEKTYKVSEHRFAGKNESAAKTNNANPQKQKTDSTGNINKAFVWLLKGDSLVHRGIETGLNDDINVQVLKGLGDNELVITGIETQAQKAAASSQEKSPFMPQRRGGSSTRSGGSAGGTR